jgi:phage regulator Rha-like protein
MYSINTHLKIQALKIESMTSEEIHALFPEVRYDNLIRTLENLIEQNVLPQIEAIGVINKNKKIRKVYTLSERDSVILVASLSPKFLGALVDHWRYLREEVENLKFMANDRYKQLNAMEALHELLPDDIQDLPLPYVKINQAVNKATSNLFSFPKMLKKNEMNNSMLIARQLILDDYLKLYEVYETTEGVKEVLYNKWQPKRLESLNV